MEAFVHDDGIIGIMLSHYMRQLSTNEYLIFSALYHIESELTWSRHAPIQPLI